MKLFFRFLFLDIFVNRNAKCTFTEGFFIFIVKVFFLLLNFLCIVRDYFDVNFCSIYCFFLLFIFVFNNRLVIFILLILGFDY